MAHVRVQLRQAIAKRLKQLGHTTRITPIIRDDPADLPVIYIDITGDEITEVAASNDVFASQARPILRHDMTLLVKVITRGEIDVDGEHDMSAALDAIWVQIEQQLLSDPTLGGLLVRLTPGTAESLGPGEFNGGVPVLGFQQSFTATLHTMATAPETSLTQQGT